MKSVTVIKYCLRKTGQGMRGSFPDGSDCKESDCNAADLGSIPGLGESINSLPLSLTHSPILTYVHDYWKNHSFAHTDLCWQSNVSAF